MTRLRIRCRVSEVTGDKVIAIAKFSKVVKDDEVVMRFTADELKDMDTRIGAEFWWNIEALPDETTYSFSPIEWEE